MATPRGIQPLKFGTVVTTGYITESVTTNHSGEELIIEDEAGDVVMHIAEFGLREEVTLEVIPKNGTSAPTPGTVFTYGNPAAKIVIQNIDKKQVKKDVEKWTIKGIRFPNVALT